MHHNHPNSPSSSGFSFLKMLSPKVSKIISFPEQPQQSESPVPKKSALEAYARKEKKGLSPGFAEQLLEYEMELEQDYVPIDIVNELTDLYTQGMMFYQAENSHKYRFFARKLEELVLKPNVKESLLRQMSPVQTRQDQTQMKRIHLENQLSKVNAEKEAFTLVKSQENKAREINKVLEGDLSSQKDRLKKRLAEKKARSQSRAQSVTYISDENSSTTEESHLEMEKDLEDLSKPVPRNKLNDIQEEDESRYTTPPRRRTKDGLMVFYQQGRKGLKAIQFDDIKDSSDAVKRGHARRLSFNKEPVPVPVPRRGRAGRAQSFGDKPPMIALEKLRQLASHPENINKEGENKSGAEEQNKEITAEKPKTHNNIVEEADDEGSRGSDSENQENENKKEKPCTTEGNQNTEENKEETVKEVERKETIEVIEEKHEAQANDVHAEGDKVTSVVISEINHSVDEHSHEYSKDAKIITSLITEEVLMGHELSQEQVHGENKEVNEKTEEEAPRASIDVVEQKDNIEPVEEENVEKKEEEGQDVQNDNAEVADMEVKEEIKEEEPIKVEEKEEVSNEVAVESEAQNENVEKTEEKTEEVKVSEEVESEVQNEKTEEVEVSEEIPSTDDNKEAQENKPAENEDKAEQAKNNRRRTDSQIADQEKLKLIKQVEDEQKELLVKFIEKQASDRDQVIKDVEEKYEKKKQALEDDTDPEERVGALWQKAIFKIAKDKELELEGVLEKLDEESAGELEKYKKKLQQQKLFKLAEISSE